MDTYLLFNILLSILLCLCLFSEITVKVGAALISFVLDSAKTESNTPAFLYTKKLLQKGTYKRVGMLMLDEAQYVDISSKEASSISPRHLPMLVPPRLWDNVKSKEGCYFRLRSSLMRTVSNFQTDALRRAKIDGVLEGIDYLGRKISSFTDCHFIPVYFISLYSTPLYFTQLYFTQLYCTQLRFALLYFTPLYSRFCPTYCLNFLKLVAVVLFYYLYSIILSTIYLLPLSFLVFSVLSNLISYFLILPCCVLPCFVLSCLVLSCPISSNLILSHIILFYLILFCFLFFCFLLLFLI